MRKLILAAALLALAAPARAQVSTFSRPILAKYNLTSGTETFCAFDPTPVLGDRGNATTSGSSTTVTSVSGSGGTPFDLVSIGDQLIFGGNSASTGLLRTVTARASSTSITVDSAINLSSPTTGYPFQFRKLSCSTDGTTGFFSVSGYNNVKVDFSVGAQTTATGIDVRLQCKIGDSLTPYKQVYPVLTPPVVAASYTTLASGTGGWIYEGIRNYSSCRLGIKCTSTCTSTQINATAQMEQVK